MTEITKKERTIIAIFDEMLRYMSPNVSCKVRVGALGRRDFVLFKTYQHTLHDYGELGIDKVDGIHHFDITLNKQALDPERSGVLTRKVLTAVENEIDLMR
tara:strand:- start:4 stop:306 length:303 start_codon:yes stop_codon:yes gene_type:complete